MNLQSRLLVNSVLIAALLAGASYPFADFVGVHGLAAIVWKGAGVGLLAIWCALQARELDGWLIASILAFGALGDVLLETSGQTAGAAAFIGGHILSIFLYFRNWRPKVTFSQRLLALLVVPVSVFAGAMWGPAGQMPEMALYALFVSGMAASAWTSRFPRYRTGIGAMLFLVSDLLIFAQMGPLAQSQLPDLLIWPLYFSGQLLICLGVIATLKTRAGK